MSQSTKEHKTPWAEIVLGTVGITALQAVITAVTAARGLVRTSTENKKLTAAVCKITKRKRLRVFILPREDTLEAFVYWHERLADSYAMRHGYGPSLASALSKLYDNMEPVIPTLLDLPALIGGKIDDLFHIHPEIGKRIEKLSS